MKIYVWLLALLCCMAIKCSSDGGCSITNPIDGTLINGVVEVTVEPTISHIVDSIAIWIDDLCVVVVPIYDPVYLWDTKEYAHGSEHTIQGIVYYENGCRSSTPTISVSIYNYRNVIAEAFIQGDGCGFDPLAESTLIDSLAKYDDTLVVICYHVDHGYSNVFSKEREAFYNAWFDTPYVIFDGTWLVWEMNPAMYYAVYEDAFLSVRDTLPAFALDVSGSANSISGTIAIQAIALQPLPQEDIRVVTVVMEDSLDGSYITHNRVCRFIECRDLKPGTTYPDTNQMTITFSHDIPVHNMTAAVVIQNMITRQILQGILIRFD